MKKYNLKKISILVISVLIIVLVICRISYVTKSARVPDLNVVPQGDKVIYKETGYKIVDAVLWEYDEFFEENENLDGHKVDITDNEIMLLVVEMDFCVYKVHCLTASSILPVLFSDEIFILKGFQRIFNGRS